MFNSELARLTTPGVGSWLRTVLSRAGVTELAWLASVDYNPPFGHVALRARDSVPQTHFEALKECHLVDKVEITGRFLNIWLLASAAEHLPARSRPLAGKTCAVEHTSITPCYPVNVATARSSVIGEMLRRCLSLLGADARGHFWLEENAYQTSSIRIAPSVRRLADHGKADHVVGTVFRNNIIGATSSQDSQPFPFAHDSAGTIHDPEGRPYLPHDIEEVRLSYAATLASLGVRHVHFDMENAVSSNWLSVLTALSSRSGTARELAGILQPQAARPRYLLRSLSYYVYLMERNDIVISVVPKRQEGTLVKAAEYAQIVAPEGGFLRLHFYGDVTFDGLRDSVRSGFFHAIDDYADDPVRLRSILDAMIFRGDNTAIDFPDVEGPTPTVRRARTRSAPLSVQIACLLDTLPISAAKFVYGRGRGALLDWREAARATLSQSDESAVPSSVLDLRRAATVLG